MRIYYNAPIFFAAVILSPCAALTKNAPLSDEARSVLAELINDNPNEYTITEQKREVRNSILSLDVDGGGLSRRDVELKEKMEDASRRANAMIWYVKFDLDGDGLIAKSEYQTVNGEKYAEIEHMIEDEALENDKALDFKATFPKYPDLTSHEEWPDLMNRFDNVDHDRDGYITLQEAFDETKQAIYNKDKVSYPGFRFLALDKDKNGIVTANEIDLSVELFMQLKQSAADWEAKAPEKRSISYSGIIIEDSDEQERKKRVALCRMPKLTSRAEILRVGLYEGAQVSNIAMAGQNRATNVATIEIEEGKTPLYIVGSQYNSTIWQFMGAVKRIEKFIIASSTNDELGKPAYGVTGISAKRISAVSLDCLGRFDGQPISPKDSEAAKRVNELLGRFPDKIIYNYKVSGLKLPSGETFKIPMNRPSALKPLNSQRIESKWNDFLRYTPEGVAEINPNHVVSHAKPEAYETLPQEAGIVQLLINKSIVYAPNGDFILKRSVRLPSGLNGGHSVTFFLGKDVDAPPGYSGYYCIKPHSRKEKMDDIATCN